MDRSVSINKRELLRSKIFTKIASTKAIKRRLEGFSNKMNKQDFVKAEFDPKKYYSQRALTRQYTAYHYNEILPYLGVQIQSNSNFVQELNGNNFLPVHFLNYTIQVQLGMISMMV